MKAFKYILTTIAVLAVAFLGFLYIQDLGRIAELKDTSNNYLRAIQSMEDDVDFYQQEIAREANYNAALILDNETLIEEFDLLMEMHLDMYSELSVAKEELIKAEIIGFGLGSSNFNTSIRERVSIAQTLIWSPGAIETESSDGNMQFFGLPYILNDEYAYGEFTDGEINGYGIFRYTSTDGVEFIWESVYENYISIGQMELYEALAFDAYLNEGFLGQMIFGLGEDFEHYLIDTVDVINFTDERYVAVVKYYFTLESSAVFILDDEAEGINYIGDNIYAVTHYVTMENFDGVYMMTDFGSRIY